MAVLADYQLERGLSDEDVAGILNERLESRRKKGREPITAGGVRLMRSRKDENVPQAWLDALEIERPEFIKESLSSGGGDEPAPAAAAGAGQGAPGVAGGPFSSLPAPVELPFDGLSARKRIILLYTGVGQGLERFQPARFAVNGEGERVRLPAPPYARVFAQHAPKLADAWIEAARQSSQVARIVTLVTTGGAVGELVVAHVSLVFSCLIVSGKVPLNGILRDLGPDAIVHGQASGGADGGSDGSGAVRVVADDAEAPSR